MYCAIDPSEALPGRPYLYPWTRAGGVFCVLDAGEDSPIDRHDRGSVAMLCFHSS